MANLRSRVCDAALLLSILATVAVVVAAPPTTVPTVGLRERTPRVHALVGARIVIAPGRVIEKGTLVIRDGLIEAVGADITAPPDGVVRDAAGRTIYAGLVDAYSELGSEAGPTTPRRPREGPPGLGPRTEPTPAPAAAGAAGYWNSHVTPQARAIDQLRRDDEANKRLRSQGIVARQIVPAQGIVRGASAVITTADDDPARVTLIDEGPLVVLLRPAARFGEGYPTSPMGAVALVRQVWHDADWYARVWEAYRQPSGQQRPEFNAALAALQPYRTAERAVILDTPDEQYFLRAHGLAQEFGLSAMMLGSGEEYKRLDEIKATGRAVILPIDFPKAPDVKVSEAALGVSLSELMHWDLAPENPARLVKAGVRVALTSHKLKGGEFLEQIRTAIHRGLSTDAALAAVTVTPCELLRVADRLGTLETGKQASFVVCDGDLFGKETKILETWVDGIRYEVESTPWVDPRGTWELTLTKADGAAETLPLKIGGRPGRLTGKLTKESKDATLTADLADFRLSLSTKADALGWTGVVRMTLVLEDDGSGGLRGTGSGEWSDGAAFRVSARRTAPYDPTTDKSERESSRREGRSDRDRPDRDRSDPDDRPEDGDSPPQGDAVAASPPEGDKPTPPPRGDRPALPPEGGKPAEPAPPERKKEDPPREALYAVNYPLGAWGYDAPPPQAEVVLLRNATVWTCAAAGTLERADVLVRQGRIAEIGSGIAAPEGATVVDAMGKHITPGILDCHSHIASDGGINEVGQAITAEVRIGDFLDANDLDIYRQLAGGVTSSNILHGSANPIGGQNQVIKLRWSLPFEQVRFAGAPPGIKFALGENVKQSNSDRGGGRYPATRMGVEQIIRDAFRAARDYQHSWDAWRANSAGQPPRVDLELEALSEVLAGKRLVHCHAYRQDEMLALLRTCEDLGVKIATFQHVLEGYKIADAIARHGAGGSSFSDWWAYKFEVYDAIPYNGALLHRAGVVTSFNSDDAEMARRLNLEAAKAMKYGGLSAEDALRFVTLNPARQLGIADRVGSLEPGKDADLVLWSGPPLSTYSRCEQTWIDGRKFFDREEDATHRQQAAQRKAALVQRVLASGQPVAGPGEGREPIRTWWARHDVYCHDHDHAEVQP